MSAALSWSDQQSFNVVGLVPGRRYTIGRGEDADVTVNDPRVSREHLAIIAGADGRHTLEHLSHTNPTLVDGRAVSGTSALSDGAVIQVGDAHIVFHDLRARDTISGPVCHVCGRENTDNDKDCWFCGTSLLNAPTTLREQRPVRLRVVSAAGKWADLYDKRWLALRPGGAIDELRDEPPADAIALHAEAGQASLRDPRAGHESDASAGLMTGTRLDVDGALFAVIAREAPAA